MKNYQRKQGNRTNKGTKSSQRKVLVSYIYLDRAQGQTFEDWDKINGRNLRWLNIVQHLNNITLQQALQSEIIVKYNKIKLCQNNMPIKSNWKYPKHLPNNNVEWCKIIITQLVRIIGFMEENIFHVVFLDKNHEFYPTEP